MADIRKTKEQLVSELRELRRRIAELEACKMQREQAEETLKRSSEFLNNVLNSTNDAISVIDVHDFRIVAVNSSFLKGLGLKEEEVVGKKCYEVTHHRSEPCAAPDDICPLCDTVRTGNYSVAEHVHYAKDGEKIYVEVTTSPIRDENGRVIQVVHIARDITERKRSEEALEESRRFFSGTLNNLLTFISVMEPNGGVIFVNNTLLEAAGIELKDVIGKIFYDTYWWAYSEEARQTIKKDIERCASGESLVHDIEVQVAGGSLMWIEYSMHPIYGKDGEIEYLVAEGRDITERRRAEAERRELERKAHLASRLATVGEMASGIAHEINNPLTAVVGFAELLMARNLPEDVMKDLEVINDSAQRVADIVRRLLMFARQYRPERSLVNVNNLIEATLRLRAYELQTGNIKVITELDPELPETVADGGQLQQVFLNLIINAEDEMSRAHGRGTLVIKTETVGDTIRVSFQDDGPGIPEENLDRIFEPFFTTKKPGEGTGLGLSICHGIVKEHNGRIYAESEPGKGATFVVEIPVVSEEKEEKPAEVVARETNPAVKAKILVVDDELPITQFLRRLLMGEGYEVRTIDNAEAALKLIESERYNLILLDIKLPGMSGFELYQHLEQMDKSLARRIIFITGDVLGTDTKNFLSRTNASYITKPFNIEQLKKEISHVLSHGEVSA